MALIPAAAVVDTGLYVVASLLAAAMLVVVALIAIRCAFRAPPPSRVRALIVFTGAVAAITANVLRLFGWLELAAVPAVVATVAFCILAVEFLKWNPDEHPRRRP